MLNTAIKLWADGAGGTRKSKHFANLLKWGADPEVRLTANWPWHTESSNTLLHCISTLTDFDTLMSSAFTSFNHPKATAPTL
jgi:hypothetical protein